MHLKLISFLFIIGVLFSCQTKKTSYFQAIVKSEKGAIRGVSLGNTFEQVEQLENDSFLIDQMIDYLYYDYEINMGNSYTVSYDFTPKNKLYEIEITTYLDEVKDASLLLNDFKNYFTEKYGNPIHDKDGLYTWYNKEGKNISYSITNKSEAYGIVVIKISDLKR